MTKRWVLCWLIFCSWFPTHSYAGTIRLFEGEIDFVNKKLNLVLGLNNKSSVSAQFASESADKIQLFAKIDHLEIPGFDLSTELESTIEAVSQKDIPERTFRGSIKSRYSLINYKPVRELSGYFEIKKQRLFLNTLSWEGFRLDGYIDLLAPHSIDLLITLDDVSLNDLSLLLGCPEEDPKLSSFISGEIKLSGFLDRLILKGKMASYNGLIEDLKYDHLLVNFEGLYPTVKITDSSVTQTDGLSFNLGGYFELSGGCDLKEKIASLETLPIIDESRIKREWTIKRKKEQGRLGSTEFKYRLRASEDYNTTLGKEDGLLGVEHSIKF